LEFICAWAERPSLGKYFELEVLKDFYLEDSWVLYISASPGQLVITVEFVLTEEHPYYSPPRAGEQYCYRKGVLVFDAVTDLNWTGLLSSRPSRDPDGSVDYGNIGSLIIEGNHYTVEGASAKSISTPHLSEWHWSRMARPYIAKAPATDL
jgi:hypothetical protein